MEEKFAEPDFHSIRLEERFVRTMETLIQKPDKSFWYIGGNRAEAKVVSRKPGSESFDREELAGAHKAAALKRMAGYGGTILAIQDTTGVNYSAWPDTEGTGHGKTLGIHSCLAVTADGLVLGILEQSSYNHGEAKDDSVSHDIKKTRPIEEKESFRWLKTLERSTMDTPPGIKVITVCDREGDMYELFAKARSLDKPLLIRIVQNRMTVGNNRILDEIRKKQQWGMVEVIIPRDSRSDLPEREAVLELQYVTYSVKRPRILNPVKTLPSSLDLNVIHVKEEHPPSGKAPIEWFLATAEPVRSHEEACEYVGHYIQRWKMERFHYILKSGCVVERLLEGNIDETTPFILTYSIIAARIMNMTYMGRLTPELPCSLLLDPDEWKMLYCAVNKTKIEPKTPYSIKEAIDYLGRLGAPKRAPGSYLPGIKTIWIGLMKLYVLLASGTA